MPLPSSYTPGSGRLAITQGFRVSLDGYTEPRLERAVSRMIDRLTRQTGMPFVAGLAPAGQGTLTITTRQASEPVQKLGEDESYSLTVTPQGAKLSAANPLGVLRGMETFLQMVTQDGQGWGATAATINDKPRFPWRGLSFDVSRHFMPLEVVKRNIDGLAAVKMNVLHLHFSDDQGYRIESKRWPKLHQLGSDGQYYTQDQVRDLIAYARTGACGWCRKWISPDTPPPYSRRIRVGGRAWTVQDRRKWGIFDPTLDPTKEQVYTFLNGLIGELAGLFPDAFFHIGGDEVSGKQWTTSEHVQAFMKEHGLKNNHEFQRYFNSRVQPIVAEYGKRMEGWDEILAPGLKKEIVIQSWRGPKSLVEAAKEGYAGLLSNGYYLDLIEPASRHYLMDPLPPESIAALDEAQRASVLGGEAAMWVEYTSPETVDSRIWPRTCRGSGAAVVPGERARSRFHVCTFGNDEPVAGVDRTNAPERTAADAAAYGRRRVRHADPAAGGCRGAGERLRTRRNGGVHAADSANRLVDAARPESDLARTFAGEVKRGEWNKVRGYLERWRDNDARLQPIIAKREILSEAAPLSTALARVAVIGLQALDAIEKGTKPDSGWLEQSRAALKSAAAPKGPMLLMIVPAVEQLVDRAGAR